MAHIETSVSPLVNVFIAPKGHVKGILYTYSCNVRHAFLSLEIVRKSYPVV